MECRLVPVPDWSLPLKEHASGVTGLPSEVSPSAYKGHTVLTTYNVSCDPRHLYNTLVDSWIAVPTALLLAMTSGSVPTTTNTLTSLVLATTPSVTCPL